MTEKPSEDKKAAGEATLDATPYRVLARKYRPLDFSALIGQEAMVRTLTNAMAAGRLAHAFILTGVRGIGKTTTARIIARALNCIGPDGTGGPTAEPCGQCANCTAIIEDRHVDVIEMDAASRTGVDDIREIIDGVRYRPVSARYKVYIIDEVHMLSKNAFNALLKTLEEPPEHVIFIFATTEIRKVPVTVLSRCQRFDLRRLDQDRLRTFLGDIATREHADVEPDALALMARAADGSVRDGLSLLDQAIAHGGAGEAVTAPAVRDMLGLADRAQILDLFDHIMAGAIAEALDLFAEMYRAGADPAVVLGDLLEFVHWLTRLKIVKEAAESTAVSETERARGREIAAKLPMSALTRTWQMLLKGLGEVRYAPDALTAAEMVLVRLAYAAELPAPADLVKEITGDAASAPTPAQAGGNGGVPSAAPSGNGGGVVVAAAGGALAAHPQPAPDVAPVAPPAPEPTVGTNAEAPAPESFEEVVALFDAHREAIIAAHLRRDVHLVRFETGHIEFRPKKGAPADLASRLGKALCDWTGARWVVSISSEPGAPTIEEQARAADDAHLREAEDHPLVRAALDIFPGAEITEVRPLAVADDDTNAGEKKGDA